MDVIALCQTSGNIRSTLCCRWGTRCLPTPWRTLDCWPRWTAWTRVSPLQLLPAVAPSAAGAAAVPLMLGCTALEQPEGVALAPAACVPPLRQSRLRALPQLQLQPPTAARCSATTPCCSWSAPTSWPAADWRRPHLPPPPLRRCSRPRPAASRPGRRGTQVGAAPPERREADGAAPPTGPA